MDGSLPNALPRHPKHRKAMQLLMFNSTHTLVGLSMARCGLERFAPSAVWTAVIAASLPDIDLVSYFGGIGSYITYHRGITHGLAGILFLSLVLAAVMHWIAGRFWNQLVIALVVMATHPVLDFMNTYGVRPFFPFERRWIYGDILFVIDPYTDLLLGAGLIFAAYARRRRTLGVALGLTLTVAYIAARIELRNMAQHQLGMLTESLPDYVSSAVSPRAINPFNWTGIVEREKDMFSVDVNVFNGVGRELVRLHKAPRSAVVDVAAATPSGSALLAFARFPVTQVQTTSFGVRVAFIDFRFYREQSGEGLAAIVDLNLSLQVVREAIGFNQRIDLSPPASSINGRP